MNQSRTFNTQTAAGLSYQQPPLPSWEVGSASSDAVVRFFRSDRCKELHAELEKKEMEVSEQTYRRPLLSDEDTKRLLSLVPEPPVGLTAGTPSAGGDDLPELLPREAAQAPAPRGFARPGDLSAGGGVV